LPGCKGKSNYNNDYRWYKGNTHTYTTVSDGDVSPGEVISWYHDHGYNFLLISDHNMYLRTDTIKLPKNHRKDFILTPDEEITDKKYVHTTAMNCKGYVSFSGDEGYSRDHANANLSVSQIIQPHVNGIDKKGGMCILNHPNYKTGIQVNDILQVKGLTHIEI
jgi:predicted metal-dependent phosphoesterase TrpH